MAKILVYDVESFPHEAYVWGKWDQNVIAFKREGIICTIGWKWLHEKRTNCFSLPDFSGYSPLRRDNKKLLRKFHNDLSKADITVAHNGVKFDERYINGEFWKNGIEPPPPHKVIDTLKVARKKFRFPSNSLNDLAVMLGVGRKLKNPGFPLWDGCMKGDPASWIKMTKYCARDVLILERVYLKMLPWIDNHPNLSNYEDARNWNCPACESPRSTEEGWAYNLQSRRKRYRCSACGKYYMGRTESHKKR